MTTPLPYLSSTPPPAAVHVRVAAAAASFFLQLLVLLHFTTILTITAALRPPQLSEELGCSPTLTALFSNNSSSNNNNKKPIYFDPLQIANDTNFSRLREAELKHGRIAMLAITETMVFPLLEKAAPEWVLFYRPDSLMERITTLSTTDVLKVVIACGWLETLWFVQKDPVDMPGDYQTGYFGVRDKGLHERELTVELENGRLAMLGILSQLLIEVFVTDGQPWELQWVNLFKRWALDL